MEDISDVLSAYGPVNYQVAGNSAVHFFNLPCFVNCQSCLRMGLNMALYLKPEIRPQEHGIAIHDDGPIIWLKQVHATANGIQQFEIEAIRGKKVDHSESYGMEERRKRAKKRLPVPTGSSESFLL